MAEALLGPAPVRTPAIDPEPLEPPAWPADPTPSAPAAPLPTRNPGMGEELLAPAPPVAPLPPPAPSWDAPEPLWSPSPPVRPADRAPMPHPPLEPRTPPVVPTAPTWAGDDLEATSTWAPEPSVDSAPSATWDSSDLAEPADEGWTLPLLSRAARPEPAESSDQGWPLPSLSGPQPVVDVAPDDDGWNLPPLVAPRPPDVEPPGSADEGPARKGLPFLGIKPAPVLPEAKASKASKARKAEAARTDALVDPTSPPPAHPSPIVAGVGAALGANAAAAAANGDTSSPSSLNSGSPFLDLRPKSVPPGAAPPKGAKGSRTGGHRRRHALIGVAAALVLVGGLVAVQLSSDDDDSTDAVLTADAASIEAEDEGSRGITLGVGEEAAAGEEEVDEAKADAADEATTDDSVVAGDDTSDSGSGDGGGGAPATPGRLTVSASALDFGSGSGEVLSIRNEGGSSLSWSASASGGGFSLASASSGSLSAGQAVNLSVAFSASGITEGTARGTLNISAGASRSVSLQALVNRNPTISGVTWVSCGPTSRLRVNVSDESGVAKVEVAGTSPAGPGFRKTAVSQGSGSYRADIGPFSSNGQITYFVEATDTRGNVARSAVQYRGWNNGC